MAIPGTSTIEATSPGWPVQLALNLILVAMVLFGLLLASGGINLAMGGGHPGAVATTLASALFVGGAGLALLYRLHFQARMLARRAETIRARYPGQPWMLDPQWAKGRIDDPQIGRVIFLYVFLACWLAGFAFIGTVNFNQIAAEMQSSPAAWAAAAFLALMTATVINLVVKVTGSWLRVGNGVLVLDTMPGRIGGSFKARLESRLVQRPEAGVRADLSCLRLQSSSSSREDDELDEDMVWWDAVTIAPAQMRKGRHGLTIPVAFAIPPDLPESDGDGVVWQLRLSSISQDDEFMLHEWIVPVFRKGRT